MATTGKTCNGALLILLPTFGLLLRSCMAFNALHSGQALGGGQSLTNGAYRFTMQSDCNLVLYGNSNVLWASGTAGLGTGCQCLMQSDGNLVVYNDASQAVWSSNTQGNSGNYELILQLDGNVVISDLSSGIQIWATDTSNQATADVTRSTVASKPTNITVNTAKLNNITMTPTKKTTVGNLTHVKVTTGKKITGNGNPPLT